MVHQRQVEVLVAFLVMVPLALQPRHLGPLLVDLVDMEVMGGLARQEVLEDQEE